MLRQERREHFLRFRRTHAGRKLLVLELHRLLELLAQSLAKKPARAVQACKRLLRRALRGQLEQAVKFENEEFAERVSSAEAREAFTLFLAKRRRAPHQAA